MPLVKLEPEPWHILVDKEVIELLSDSNDEIMIMGAVLRAEPPEPATIIKVATRRKGPAKEHRKSSNLELDPSKFMQESNTIWTDSDITSRRIDEVLQVTLELKVDRVEYLSKIPNIWPVPQIPTAFIVDLRDSKHQENNSLLNFT